MPPPHTLLIQITVFKNIILKKVSNKPVISKQQVHSYVLAFKTFQENITINSDYIDIAFWLVQPLHRFCYKMVKTKEMNTRQKQKKIITKRDILWVTSLYQQNF